MSEIRLSEATFLAAHPELPSLLDAVAWGDWLVVSHGINRFHPGSDRSFLCALVSEHPGARKLVERVADDDPLAAVLLARVEVREAWEIRTGQRAENVTREQFRGFRAKLVDAERRLTRAIARQPDLGDAWVARLTTARGLELGHSEARRRWERARELSPDDLWAHRDMLQYWAPKWFGSWDLMFGFVDEAVRAAPPGSPVHALVAYAHLERWFDLDGGKPGRDYLNDPPVAYQASTAAAQGPDHPQYVRGYGWPAVENAFAMLFALAGDTQRSSRHFERLAPSWATDAPWYYLGDPREQFDKYRRLTLGAGR